MSGLIGIALILAAALLLSNNRKTIDWRLVTWPDWVFSPWFAVLWRHTFLRHLPVSCTLTLRQPAALPW